MVMGGFGGMGMSRSEEVMRGGYGSYELWFHGK